nr:MAG TPA: hypothetical protein [Caudoviricetes sp.]
MLANFVCKKAPAYGIAGAFVIHLNPKEDHGHGYENT